MSILFLRRARAATMAVSWGVVIVLVGIQAGRSALAAPSYAQSVDQSLPGAAPAPPAAAVAPHDPRPIVTAMAQGAVVGLILQPEGTEGQILVTDVTGDALVAGIDLKVSVETMVEPALDVYLAAPGAPWQQVPLRPITVEVGIKTIPDPQPAEKLGLMATAQTIHLFDGLAAPGTWMVKLVPRTPDLVGSTAAVSLRILYTTTDRFPTLESPDDQAFPAIERLPEVIRKSPKPLTGGPGENESQEKVLVGPLTAADAIVGWNTIKSEGFEDEFPNSGWTLWDASPDGNERLWGRTTWIASAGTWSGWPASGGANGVDPRYTYYPNNVDSWMIYGPFDLSDAVDAKTSFHLWRQIAPDYDYLFFGVSDDFTNFYGWRWDGSVDWRQEIISYPDWQGRSRVWVAWLFHSDNTIVDDGPFMDNINIEKDVMAPTPTPTSTNTRTLIPPTATWTPTFTRTPTRKPIPTNTPTPTWTPTFTRTPTRTPVPTNTPTPSRTPTPTPVPITFSGDVTYLDGGVSYRVPYVKVYLIDNATGGTLRTGWSDANGHYVFPAVSLQPGSQVHVRGETGNDHLTIGTDPFGSVYSKDGDDYTVSTSIQQTVDLRIPVLDAGPWMIMRTIETQWDPGCTDVTIYWPSLISQPYAYGCSLWLRGGDEQDQHDPDVILHEYAHTKMWGDFGYWPCGIPIPGLPPCYRAHPWNRVIDPNFAWSEGWPDFYQAMVQNEGNYVDSNSGGGFSINLETDPHNWVLGANVEGSVAGLLWDLFDPVNPAENDDIQLTVNEIRNGYGDHPIEIGAYNQGTHADNIYEEFWQNLRNRGKTCSQLWNTFNSFNIRTGCAPT
uniref:carboxypeptidase-like regulatory domain-containing protein n=1 Tax=Candidatus Amarolinea aalborgensis TaxID=2249329 RepID=UPI003BFA23C0